MRKVFGSREKAVLIGSAEDMSLLWLDIEMNGRRDAVLGIFTDDAVDKVQPSLNVLGTLDEAPSYFDGETAVSVVFCSPERLTEESSEAIFRKCEEKGIRFCAMPPRLNLYGRNLCLRRAGYSSVLTIGKEPMRGLAARAVKRVSDILVSLAVLLSVMPLATVVAAVLTKRRGGGPVLSAVRRTGARGKSFREYSFSAFGKGAWSRLPHFINVLWGDISVVGPRESVRPWVKPGITGMAQCLGYGADDAYGARVDVWYVEHWTLWLDLEILMRRV